MSNMSYCRFHNTLLALRDCRHILDEMPYAEHDPLSEDELQSSIELIKTCDDILCIASSIMNREYFTMRPNELLALAEKLKLLNDEAIEELEDRAVDDADQRTERELGLL